MLFALVDSNGQFVQERNLSPIRDFPSKPKDPIGKGWKWLPVEDTDPPYNAQTQVKEGPAVTIQPAKVVRIWTVRDKTAQELDTEKEAEIGSLRVIRAVVLAIADGSLTAGLTPAQARAAVKAKM